MLLKAFKEYCIENNYSDLLQYIPEIRNVKQTENLSTETEINQDGFVYLYQAGKHYKIGRTNDINRRDREIDLQLPIQANLIHRIPTDDPVGIEKYWHFRFSSKRLNGEWFNLTSSDIKAFKRRKFM